MVSEYNVMAHSECGDVETLCLSVCVNFAGSDNPSGVSLSGWSDGAEAGVRLGRCIRITS